MKQHYFKYQKYMPIFWSNLNAAILWLIITDKIMSKIMFIFIVVDGFYMFILYYKFFAPCSQLTSLLNSL